MGSVGSRVGPDRLEHDPAEPAGEARQFVDPATEAQVAHAAAFEPARLEGQGARGDAAVLAAQGPARGGAEVEGQDGILCQGDGRCDGHWWAACVGGGHGESQQSHDGLREGMVLVRAATARFLAELAVAARLRGADRRSGRPACDRD
ncbi:MAG: hypothetical protein ACK56I_20030, partial [bacterium]